VIFRSRHWSAVPEFDQRRRIGSVPIRIIVELTSERHVAFRLALAEQHLTVAANARRRVIRGGRSRRRRRRGGGKRAVVLVRRVQARAPREVLLLRRAHVAIVHVPVVAVARALKFRPVIAIEEVLAATAVIRLRSDAVAARRVRFARRGGVRRRRRRAVGLRGAC